MKVDWVPVSKLFHLERRSVDVAPDHDYQEIGVRSFGKGLFVKEPVGGVELGTKRVFRVENGDLVVSNVFAWEGAVGLAATEHDGLIGSHRFMTWVADDPYLNTRYVLEFFRSKQGVAKLGEASPGSAGRNRTLAIKNFEEILVPVPSRADQDRVATHLEFLARATDRASNAEARATSLLTTLRERTFSRLAQGPMAPLSEILTSVDQLVDVETEAEYPMLGVRSFGRGAFNSGTMPGSGTAYSRLRRFRAGQICYPKLMAWQGAFAVISEDLDDHFASPEFVGFGIDNSKAVTRYLAHCLTWSVLLAQAVERSTGTNANRRRLQPRDLLSIEVPLPPLPIQSAVASQLDLALHGVTTATSLTEYAAAILPAARNEIFGQLVSHASGSHPLPHGSYCDRAQRRKKLPSAHS